MELPANTGLYIKAENIYQNNKGVWSMKESKEKSLEDKYKIFKKSCFYYALTAILTPPVAVVLAISARNSEELYNLIFLVILTEVYTVVRAFFDYEETRKLRKFLSDTPSELSKESP